MNEMYEDLQMQNNEEEMDMQMASDNPESKQANKKKKRGFLSNVNDQLSSNTHPAKKFNLNSLNRK